MGEKGEEYNEYKLTVRRSYKSLFIEERVYDDQGPMVAVNTMYLDAALDKRLKYISETITPVGIDIQKIIEKQGSSDLFVRKFLERMAHKLPNPMVVLERLKRIPKP